MENQTQSVSSTTVPPVSPTPALSQTSNAEQKVTQEPDLLTRVSQFKKPETTTPPKQEGDVDFDFKELDTIKTPEEAKSYAEKAYKSMQSGFNKKFQEVASLRKTLEKQMQDFTDWSPEKIQNLLNDPKFVQAAQKVAESKAPPTYQGTDQEWSNLSDSEKVKFQQMEQEITMLKQQNTQTLMKQQDEQLKQKYANYAPDIVDTTLNNLIQGKQVATREDIWKVVDYEDMAKRAYELGKQDERNSKYEKSQSMSIDGSTVNHNQEKPTPEKGEKDTDFFRRVALRNISLYGNKK